jgi:hypothetical protein
MKHIPAGSQRKKSAKATGCRKPSQRLVNGETCSTCVTCPTRHSATTRSTLMRHRVVVPHDPTTFRPQQNFGSRSARTVLVVAGPVNNPVVRREQRAVGQDRRINYCRDLLAHLIPTVVDAPVLEV